MTFLFKLRLHYFSFSISLILFSVFAHAQESQSDSIKALLLGQDDQLLRVKAEIAAGNPEFVASLEEIIKDADEWLE